MRLESAAATHAGLVRTVNEDAFLALPGLVLVADGMGGHAAGDVASALVVHTFDPLGGADHRQAGDVVKAIGEANRAILAEARRHPEKLGMGTTLSGLAVVDEAGAQHWLVFNVGDSRVYRIEDGNARQLTVDHSEVAELVASGRLSRGAVRTHPLRHVITRSLGSTPPPYADTWLVPVAAGDLFLVCSDGLTDELDDAQIAALMLESPDVRVAATNLVEAAVRAGGRDNITVVVVAATPDSDEAAVVELEATVATVPRSTLVGTEREASR